MTFHPLKATKFIKRLMWAQGHECFLCDGPMALVLATGETTKNAVTREHVFPHATTGKRLVNNIVLSHSRCNTARAGREPSDGQISKAARIYKRMRLVPFLAADCCGIDFAANKRRQQGAP